MHQPRPRRNVPPPEQTTAVVMGVTIMSTVVVIGAIVLAGVSEEDVTPLVTVLLGFLATATMALVNMLKTAEVAQGTKASGEKLDEIKTALNGGFEDRIAAVVERVLVSHGILETKTAGAETPADTGTETGGTVAPGR